MFDIACKVTWVLLPGYKRIGENMDELKANSDLIHLPTNSATHFLTLRTAVLILTPQFYRLSQGVLEELQRA